MEIYENIVAAIGNTPLVRLGRIHPPGNLVAKMEYMNPGGSSKDRIGLAMIERAEANGWLEPGGTIVEPTSGNTGVGLAMAAALKGYKMVAVMADKQSIEKQDLLSAYGHRTPHAPDAKSSPVLDELAAQGVLLEEAYATTSWMLPSSARCCWGTAFQDPPWARFETT